ncbi:hypothetical protein M433DRAFT_1226 [Acidomyces richmondensis BFW]|nr:MAG: hypothetical protein FE78DRAFT_34420 [Acidomyces sp. 'richmondensis']KYG49348.1 hypothetical protein M433DRAFT_1226 [Acidomyces richmondensis BFW]
MDEAFHSKFGNNTICFDSNGKQFAFATHRGIFIRSQDNHGKNYCTIGAGFSNAFKPALALPPAARNRIAISQQSKITIFDTTTGLSTHTLAGTGRAVTSLAWSYCPDSLLASGTIDGALAIWSLKDPSQPIHQLPPLGIACQAVTFSTIDQTVIASAHDDHVVIWSLKNRYKPLHTLSVGQEKVIRLAWHPVISGRLLTVSTDGVVQIWDVSAVFSRRAGCNFEDGDHNVSAVTGETHTTTHPIATLRGSSTIVNAEWLGEHGFVALTANGLVAQCFSFGADWEMLHEVWHLNLDQPADTVVVSQRQGSTVLITASKFNSQVTPVPGAILDSVGGHVQPCLSATSIDAQDLAKISVASRSPPHSNERILKTGGGVMRPVSIQALGEKNAIHSKTSGQLHQRSCKACEKSKETTCPATSDSIVSTLSTPRSRAIFSDNEPSKDRTGASGSPMPFLSPSVPARASTTELPLIDSSLHLPPLQHTSFDSDVLRTGNESDSDDETFTNGKCSGDFMPGGVSVPLPKACGALFGPSGHLLTFFPYKPQSSSPQTVKFATSQSAEHLFKTRLLARVFETFGNLVADYRRPGEQSDLDSNGSSEPTTPQSIGDLPEFALYPSSFSAKPSWNSKASPTKPVFRQKEAQHEIIVSVSEMDCSVTSSTIVAAKYRVLCQKGESGSLLCQHNALVAESAGLDDVSDMWRLMAMLIEDHVPLDVFNPMEYGENSGGDIIVLARTAISSLRNGSELPLHDLTSRTKLHGKLRWADHPFGARWLIRKIFDWAERRADIQMLACMSAVLAGGQSSLTNVYGTAQESELKFLPTFGITYNLRTELIGNDSPHERAVARFSTEPSTAGTYISPTKLISSLEASSREPSQPPTPHIESTASTPPLSLPSFSRQGTKMSLSASGSASPEIHRSSFSAAARHYAQSITDKIASYGTSPPDKKKSSISPNTPELSSSLPGMSGSWSKSVSFATGSTDKDGQLKGEFENSDCGYDSDKTIEDSSVPQTPKSPQAPITLHLSNCDSFTDRVSGVIELPLLPPDILLMGMVWCQHYAEQLRCAGLLIQAAEIEKASGLTHPVPTEQKRPSGVIPAPVIGQRKASCSICDTMIRKVEQVCSACLHTCHFRCLENYLESQNSVMFECPSGCGCHCADIPFELTDLLLSEKDRGNVKIRKKSSFTDPSRWRAKIEGESW